MIHQYDIAIPGGPRTSLSMGERRLLLATLRDALGTLLGDRYGGRHAKHQREDLDWLTSDDESDPFTYVRICGALGIDAGWLRNRVLAARAARSDRPRLVVAPVETVDDWTPLHAQGGWS